jgi:hypothetical protein
VKYFTGRLDQAARLIFEVKKESTLKQIRNQGSTWLYYLILLLAVPALLAGLAGCAGNEASSTGNDDVSEVSEVALEPTAAPATPTDEAIATADSEEVIVAEAVEPSTCFDCHTDKDLLIATADPEEEVISENEGEG